MGDLVTKFYPLAFKTDTRAWLATAVKSPIYPLALGYTGGCDMMMSTGEPAGTGEAQTMGNQRPAL